MIYHVSVYGDDAHPGSEALPLRTISRAAALAAPGDTVRVHSGVYRESVDPPRGGTGEEARIVYEAAAGEKPVIKGSEAVSGWERVEGTVWKKTLPNAFFGEMNPYLEKIEGDWLLEPAGYDVHRGDVYINGKSMYEASSMEDLIASPLREVCCQNIWRIAPERVLRPEDTVYRWFALVDEKNTTIYGNFHEYDPNKELIEINVRESCFFPSRQGINYITVRGFEMAHAATGWNPPTARQTGMVGPYWSKGWIIENNDLHDSKTSAVCVGKNEAGGHNLSTRFARKSGHRYQAEAVFAALRDGWSKEKIGSHLIQNNVIHDCGQNAIVGHMGGAFCVIRHNHIYNIGVKHEFWGHEMAGIKLHAAIDARIENNNIHHCTLGTWLDWEAQGVRVTRNLYHHNDRDFMIEVTHGPALVDNNAFLSAYSLDNHAQGTAFVHNIISGVVYQRLIPDRATPYHFPHSTLVMGYAPVYGGDDRVYNNIFTGVSPDLNAGGDPSYVNLCSNYDRFSAPEEYDEKMKNPDRPRFDHRLHAGIPHAVWIGDNVYSGHARPFRAEKGATSVGGLSAGVLEEDGRWILKLTVPPGALNAVCRPVDGARLGTPRLTEEPYEEPDGSPCDLSTDLTGAKRTGRLFPGPLAKLAAGEMKVVVWEP